MAETHSKARASSPYELVPNILRYLFYKLELKYRVEKISKIKRVEDVLFLLIFVSTRSLTNLSYDRPSADSSVMQFPISTSYSTVLPEY